MAKKKAKAENLPEAPVTEFVDPFIGGEEDDLSDMEYIQDENSTTKVETHPPETDEEAAAAKEQQFEDPTPPESEEQDDGVQEEEEPQAVQQEEEVAPETGEPRIPKDRFDEVNQRMKRAEERVKQLEQQLTSKVKESTTEPEPAPEPEPEPYDYAAKDQEAMDALLEGDAKRYSQIQAEIREAARVEALREAKKLATEGDRQVRESLTFEEAAAKIEHDYPQFSEGNEAFNQEAYNELMELYLGYAKSGRYSRVDAMRKAADKAVKIHGLQAVGDVPAQEPPDNVVSITKPDIASKAKMAERQPPKTQAGVSGKDEPTVDINSMSDEQYAALPESTKRRLRGDIL